MMSVFVSPVIAAVTVGKEPEQPRWCINEDDVLHFHLIFRVCVHVVRCTTVNVEDFLKRFILFWNSISGKAQQYVITTQVLQQWLRLSSLSVSLCSVTCTHRPTHTFYPWRHPLVCIMSLSLIVIPLSFIFYCLSLSLKHLILILTFTLSHIFLCCFILLKKNGNLLWFIFWPLFFFSS